MVVKHEAYYALLTLRRRATWRVRGIEFCRLSLYSSTKSRDTCDARNSSSWSPRNRTFPAKRYPHTCACYFESNRTPPISRTLCSKNYSLRRNNSALGQRAREGRDLERCDLMCFDLINVKFIYRSNETLIKSLKGYDIHWKMEPKDYDWKRTFFPSRERH